MAGGTHVFDMIKRLKENENLKNKNYFKIRNTYKRVTALHLTDYKTASKEQRASIRKAIIAERKKENTKSILALTLSVIITAVLIITILTIRLRHQ